MQAQRVNRTFQIDGSGDRVVLFSWGADPSPLKQNVVRIDPVGNVVWRAALPTGAVRDCFVGLARDGDGFVARTYSEWAVHLDADGNVTTVDRATS